MKKVRVVSLTSDTTNGPPLHFYETLSKYSRTSMAGTSLGPLKFVRDMGSSSH